MPVDGEPLAVARRFVEAKETGDWETVRSVTADSFTATDTDLHPDELVETLGGDWDAVAPLLAERFVPVEEGIDAETFVEVRTSWRDRFSFDEHRFEDLSTEGGDRVVYRASLVETHDGMYHGHEPTGDAIETVRLGVLRVGEAGVTDYRMAVNTADFLAQMGVTPGGPVQAKIENQFYKVVNRVLRHNLRNDLSAVGGYADLVAAGSGDPGDSAERIKRTVDDLVATVEKVRTVENRVLDAAGSDAVDVGAVVRSVVEDHRQDAAGRELAVTLPAEPVAVTSNEPLLATAVTELVENAVDHTDDDVTVEVSRAPDDEDHAATVAVADRGSGIPDDEVAPLSQERETSLEHGSGIGLWAVKWSVERLGGAVEFDERDHGGSAVRLHVPDVPLEEVK